MKRFREWLAREFADALDGGVVLDVAGGKGVLAFDLMNSTNAAEVWVIDPRAMRLGRLRRRFALGFHLRERERDAATIRVREPKHLRVYWSREVYAREDAAWEARVRASNVAARASRWCVSGLVADDRRDARYEDAGATMRVVDGAVDAMSGLTAQPSLGAIAASVADTPLDCGLDREQYAKVASVWQQIQVDLFTAWIGRKLHEDLIPGIFDDVVTEDDLAYKLRLARSIVLSGKTNRCATIGRYQDFDAGA